MQIKETLHEVVQSILDGSALTLAGWSQEGEEKLKAAIAAATSKGLSEKAVDMLKAKCVAFC